MMRFDKFQRRVFPQFKANELGEFPIPNASLTQQEEIAKLVKVLMDNMEKESESYLIFQLNQHIDDLVMDLFDLSEQEKQKVHEFHI